MEPFLTMIVVVAVDENNSIAREGKLPWPSLPTDFNWYLTHATTTKDPSKRIGVIVGRVTFEELLQLPEKYISRWHFIVITRQTSEQFSAAHPTVDVVQSFDQAIEQGKSLLDNPQRGIESIVLLGGADPYERALKSKLIKRLYLTRVFAQFPNCDTRISNLDVTQFRRIRRAENEILAELDEKIIEENGIKYQFQVYEP